MTLTYARHLLQRGRRAAAASCREASGQHGELSLAAYDDPGPGGDCGGEAPSGKDICVLIVYSCCCAAETNTTL